jgi:hypothetical protein
MKFSKAPSFFIASLFLVACTSSPGAQSATQSEDPVESADVLPTTTVLSNLPQPVSPARFVPLDNCLISTPEFDTRLETNGPRPTVAGFPRFDNSFPPSKPSVLILPFEFEDAPISDAVVGATAGGFKSANRYFELVSWGKAGIDYEVAPENLWIRIPKPATALNFAMDSPKNRHSWYWFRDVLDHASAELQLENYHIVYLVGPSTVIEWFTAIMDLTEPPIESPGGTVRRALMVTRDYSNSGTIAHEMGHAWLSLEDLYSQIPEAKDFVGLNRFDLMTGGGLSQYSANDMTIWNKLLAGWVSEEMFLCADTPGTYRAFISANSDNNSLPKAMGIRLSESRILMIETWRKSTFNLCCDETIAYVVDAGRAAGSGPYRLQGALKEPGTQLDLDQANFVTVSNLNLIPNENVPFESISIRLVASDVSGTIVEVVIS